MKANFFSILPSTSAICAFSFWVFFPGLYNADSIGIYSQAIYGDIDDWHSVFMSFLWGSLSWITPGPPIILFISQFLIVSSVLFILKCLLRNVFAATIIGCVFFLTPPVFNLLGMATKDALFMGIFLWFLGFINAYSNDEYFGKKKVFVLLGVLILATLSCLIRLDAVVLILFSLVAKGFVCHIRSGNLLFMRAFLKGVIVFPFGVVLFSLVCVQGINYVADAKRSYSIQPILFHDIAGVSILSGKYLFPNRYKEMGVTEELIQENFTTSFTDTLWFTPAAQSVRVKEREQFIELFSHWLAAIAEEPAAYIEHRLSMLHLTLRTLPDEPVWKYALVESDTRAPLYLDDPGSKNFTDTFNPIWDWYSSSIVWQSIPYHAYDGYFYLILAGLGLILPSMLLLGRGKFKLHVEMRMLPFVGVIVGNIVVVLILVPSSLFRYIYPLVFSSFLIFAMLLEALFRCANAFFANRRGQELSRIK
jgi:hypothetical protein